MFEYKLHLLAWNTAVAVFVESSECFFIESLLIVFFMKIQHHFREISEGDLSASIVQFVFYVLKFLLGGIGSGTSHGFQQIIGRDGWFAGAKQVESLVVTGQGIVCCQRVGGTGKLTLIQRYLLII